jgi:hypothetical protein
MGGVISVASALVLLVSAKWFEATGALVLARATYWFAIGSWLRTPWGESTDAGPLPGPPPLDGSRLRRYLVLGGCAAGASAGAHTLQLAGVG